MNELVAVIVTFNRLEHLKKTVQASLSEPMDRCVIVNNASTDGTKSWLDELSDERIDVIHCDKNLGGAGGFHIGFKAAIEKHHATWLVCYDDDAYPRQGVVAKFKEKVQNYNPGIGGVAAAVYSEANDIVEMNRPGLRPFANLSQSVKTIVKGRMGFHIDDKSYQGQPREIYNASFVGLFVKATAIKKVGYPRKELFIYGDDVLYSMDLADHGFTVLFDPVLEFVHDCKTIDKTDITYKPLWKAYYTYRNAIEIYRREAGLIFPVILLSKSLLWLSKARYYEHKSKYLKLVYHSIVDGVKRDFSRTHDQVLALFS